MSETKNVQDAVHEPERPGKSGKKYAGKTILLLLITAAAGAYFIWPPYRGVVDSIFAAFATGDFAAESPCGTVVSYCASCRSAMRTGGRESLHLLDLVLGGDWTGRPTPPPDRSLRSWLNRWRTKQLLGKLPHRSARDDLAAP